MAIGKKRIGLFERRKRAKTRIEGIRLLRLYTRTTVGIAGEPAAAVQLAGSAAVLFAMLTTRIAESGSASAGLSETTLFRITAKAQALVQPLPLALGIARGRIARRKAANNTGKTNEKRAAYASC